MQSTNPLYLQFHVHRFNCLWIVQNCDMYFLDRIHTDCSRVSRVMIIHHQGICGWPGVLTAFDGAATAGLLKAEGQQTGVVTDSQVPDSASVTEYFSLTV